MRINIRSYSYLLAQPQAKFSPFALHTPDPVKPIFQNSPALQDLHQDSYDCSGNVPTLMFWQVFGTEHI